VAEVICYQAVSHTAAGVAGSSTGLRTAAAAAPDCIARLMGDAMRNRTCRGCGKNFLPRAKAKHCSRECRRKGYLAGWKKPSERKSRA
jgi:hypothetical protein